MWNLDKLVPDKKTTRREKLLKISILFMISVVGSVFFVLHTRYIIHPVSGSSMEPTIQDGQYVLIEKNKKINRYEIVAFSGTGKDDMYIKRIIGVPGDKITVQGTKLILSLETMMSFDSTIQLKLSSTTAEQFAGVKEIPEGCYFVLGDHMEVSEDSRNFGFIEKVQIEGILKEILPKSKKGIFLQILKGGRNVLGLNILAAGLLFIIFVILAIRLLLHYRLEQVKNLEQYPSIFRRKLRVLKSLESQKNSFFLLITSSLIGVILCLLLISLFRMETKLFIAQNQTTQIEKEMKKIKTQQNELLSKVTVRSYPEEGIGLKDLSWTGLVENDKQKELQPKIETELTQKLAPYFGLIQATVSVDVPSKTLLISLMGNTENDENQDKIENNVESFIKEAKEIPKLTQITIEVVMTAHQKQEKIYEGIFLRDKDQESFSKLETNTQKGKG